MDSAWVNERADRDLSAGGTETEEGGGAAPGVQLPSRALARLFAAWVIFATLLACLGFVRLRRSFDAPLAFHGVRLGLAARDVRDRFTLPGGWKAEPEQLSWTPGDEHQSVRETHFEFHMGSLVAVRARVAPGDDSARGEPLQTTQASVLARSPRADGDVDLLLVARDCPTHAAEVARLLVGP